MDTPKHHITIDAPPREEKDREQGDAASAKGNRPRGQSFVTCPSADAAVRRSVRSKSVSWRWLGFLKRSLSYGLEECDGGDPAAGVSPASSSDEGGDGRSHSFSEEDREALDAVFSSGAGRAREAERMRAALSELADDLEELRKREAARLERERGSGAAEVANEEEKDATAAAADLPPLSARREDRMVEVLLEVRDICQDRVDFSRAFMAMGGLDLLLGCACERSAIPAGVRSTCFLLLSTLANRNVPMQLRLLHQGAVSVLAALYFAEFPVEAKSEGAAGEDENGMLRGRIVQAIDAAVWCHASAERRFCSSERGRRVVESGLGMSSLDEATAVFPPRRPPAALRKRCLSLLRELLTSPHSSPERFRLFAPALSHVASVMTMPETEPDERIREVALRLVLKVLRLRRDKKRSSAADIFVEMKEELMKMGGSRVEDIAGMDPVEREVSGDAERDPWYGIMNELGRA